MKHPIKGLAAKLLMIGAGAGLAGSQSGCTPMDARAGVAGIGLHAAGTILDDILVGGSNRQNELEAAQIQARAYRQAAEIQARAQRDAALIAAGKETERGFYDRNGNWQEVSFKSGVFNFYKSEPNKRNSTNKPDNQVFYAGDEIGLFLEIPASEKGKLLKILVQTEGRTFKIDETTVNPQQMYRDEKDEKWIKPKFTVQYAPDMTAYCSSYENNIWRVGDGKNQRLKIEIYLNDELKATKNCILNKDDSALEKAAEEPIGAENSGTTLDE